MSNHYPSRNRYVPSRYLPTHYYRKHHEFGIPFKRYPLNYDEHEESGYYIDFNQTHLVYAVPCTDITFSKKYNRDDLKNCTVDTTAETRETVGTTAARYHDNTHSRHYPHCAHSSHVQGFDVLTITKLMDYELQLHDVTPERLKTLFENFACPQRDTVVFEHVWFEQHKFLSMYFKVHKKPLLDYCLFRFPEPPVCPGPVPPTPGEGPVVVSITPMTRYIDPETCVAYIDLLVTFDKDITPLVSDLKEIFGVRNYETDLYEEVLNVVQNESNSMILTTTIDKEYGTNLDTLYVDTKLWNVEDLEGNAGEGTQTNIVELGSYGFALTVSYEDHQFDDTSNTTKVWLAYSRFDASINPNEQEEVPVDFASSNIQPVYTRNYLEIKDLVEGTSSQVFPASVNTHVQHDGHDCVELIFNTLANADPTKEVSCTSGAYLYKYVDPETSQVYLNSVEETFVIQWSNVERVISNYGLMSNSEQEVTGLWVLYPCNEEDILTVDLSKITRAPYDDLSNTVNPIAYNLGRYIQQSEFIPQAGREVFLTFSPNITFSDRYTYTINAEAITDDSGHYNAYWIHAIPDPEPQPDHGPILLSVWGDYDPAQANPAKVECVFDQDVEIVNTSGIKVVYSSEFGENLTEVFSNMSLSEFNTFITDVVNYVQNDIQVIPEGGTPDPNYNYVDYYMDYADQQQSMLRHQDSGKVYKDNQTIENYLPYINYTDEEQLSYTNQQIFGASSTLYYSQMYGLVDWMPESCAAINKLFEDLATRNSITVAEMFDGSHATAVGELRWLAEYTIPHYSYWLDLVKAGTETNAQYQAHINALYNEPLGGQTYPDDAILATRSIVDGASVELGISVSDLLTDPNYAIDIKRVTDYAGRALVFIWMLTYACTDTYKLATLNSIYDGTYSHTNVGVNITYYPLTNWITVDRLTFSTDLTNLVIEFNEPIVRTRSVYVEIPINTVRNPATGYVNRDGVDYAYFSTPEIIFYNPWGEYNSSTNTTTVGLNFNNNVDFIGNLSDITITDGIHTAHPTSLVPMYPDNYNNYYVIFDNSVDTSWAGNQTIDLDIAQGVFENREDPTYTNDAYTAQFYVYSDQPPVVITHTVTYDAQGGNPEPAPEVVNDGESATMPPTPTKPNYSFNYWTLNGVQYDWGPVYDDITLVADWTYVPPVGTNPYVIGVLLTHDSTKAYPYQIEYTFDQNILLGSSTGSITDGNYTVGPDNVVVSGDTLLYQFLEPNPNWFSSSAGNLDISIPAGAVTDSTGSYNSLAYSDTGLAFSEVGPTPPVGSAPVLTAVSSTNNVGQDYTITLTFDQDIVAVDWDSAIEVISGANSTTADSYSVSGHSLTLMIGTPYPTDWISGATCTINILSDLVRDLSATYPNNPETLPNFVFGQAYPYPPATNITVTFDSDGGSAVASQTIQSGTIPTRPSNPTKSGYTFNYWKLNGSQYNFDVALSSNTTLVADWTYNPPAPTPVNPGTSVYGSYHVIHTYSGTYSQTNTLQMTMNVETSQSGSTAYYRATGNVKAVPGPGASGTTYSNGGVKVTITIAGRSITSAETGNLSSSQDPPKSYDTGWLEVPNGVGTGTESMGIAVKDATTGGSGGYCNYSDTASVNKPYTQ